MAMDGKCESKDGVFKNSSKYDLCRKEENPRIRQWVMTGAVYYCMLASVSGKVFAEFSSYFNFAKFLQNFYAFSDVRLGHSVSLFGAGFALLCGCV